jgi:toxin FitB
VSYLVDTNVISELVRPKPSPDVVNWFEQVPWQSLHLSVLTAGELRSGVERLAAGSRREKLRIWLEQDLPGWFGDRLLPVSADVADRWGQLIAASGRPLAVVDSLIAATALHHRLRLVTRNTGDFSFAGLEIVNPWLR